tara:strand:- start:1040 stop:1327 length:288 start_codon:yes stop_codon:yes gene_type:complete
MSIKHRNTSLTDTLDETSPLIQACNGPQLMLARFTGFSIFYKNKKYNQKIQDDWIRNNPHRVNRPKARTQTLNTEMTKDEYFEQEQARAQTKKKR